MEIIMNATNYSYSTPAKTIHMGLAIFGIFSYLTAEGAEHSDGGFGYQLHAYLGLTLMTFIILRILHAYTGTAQKRLSIWSLFSKSQWKQAIDDVRSLLQIKIPERGMHEGLAGLVQAFGLIIFTWMGATGTVLYFIDERLNGTLYEIFEEAHEVGESMIPLFLMLHVGAVIVHSISGRPNWSRMWSFNK
jgi:cytochrome b561